MTPPPALPPLRPMLATLALALLASPALADVNYRTGEFSVQAEDLTLGSGIEPSLKRFYTSNNSAVGMFGRGWSSTYETWLTFEEDGAIVVHEEASAAGRRFLPLDSATPSARDAARVPVGRRYETRCPFQHLERTATGFELAFDYGNTLSFDEQGRLTRVANRSGNFFSVTHGVNARPALVTDDLGRTVRFQYNVQGLVESARDDAGHEARFRYDPSGALIEARSATGQVYRYEYDAITGRLQRVAVGDNDGSQTIAYDEEGRTLSVTEADGAVTEYFYARRPEQPGFLRVDVRVRQGATALSASTYEYDLFDTGFGDQGISRLRATQDGDVTEAVYNACCGRPTSIQRGDELATFTYDDRGHLIRKSRPDGETTLEYDVRANKVSAVHQRDHSGTETWARFTYDDAHNLVRAENSESKHVTIEYDAKGRIQHMVDQDGNALEFEYNALSKPVVIRNPALGSIRVSYDASGEIQKVDSDDGSRKIALSVTSAFQNLLDLIRPAQVSETF